MKSILMAIAVMVAGLSSGCAELDQLAKQDNPDNARFSQTAFPSIRQDVAPRLTYAEEMKRERAQVGLPPLLSIEEKQEREHLVNATIDRVRAVEGRKSTDVDLSVTQEEIDLQQWGSTSEATTEDMKKTLKTWETKMIAAAKKEAQIAAKEAAYAASPAGKLKAKREAAAQAKADAAAMNMIFGKKGIFGKEIERINKMTPEERYQMERETAARSNAERQQRSRENSARVQAQQDRNIFCHRNFGRSC